MKKFLIYALSLIFVSSAFISCSDDDDDNGKIPGDDWNYSSLTPEQQKEKLSEEALGLLSEMQDLSNAKGVELLTTFYFLSDYLFDDDDEVSVSNQTQKNIFSVKSALDIADLLGKYTWNVQTQSFDWEPAENIVIEIPSSLTSIENDGKIEANILGITNIGQEILPTEVSIKMYVAGKEEGSITAKATYGSTVIPNTAQATFVIDQYTVTANASKGSTNKAEVTLKKGSKTLIEGNATATGDVDKVVAGTAYPEGGEAVVKITDNLQVSGEIEYAKMAAAMYALEEEAEKKYKEEGAWTNELEEWYSKEYVKIQNQYIDANLISRSNKYKIAQLEFISVDDSYTWGSTTYTDFYEVPALRFNDNTVIEAEVYFGTGFDKVLAALNELILEFYPEF